MVRRRIRDLRALRQNYLEHVVDSEQFNRTLPVFANPDIEAGGHGY